MKKQILSAAILATFGAVASTGAMAAVVNAGDTLTINAAQIDPSTSFVTGGSYFLMDTNGSGTFTISERTGIQQGTQGIIIGSTQSTGTSHSGTPTGTEGGTIDAAWNFFKNTGMHFTSGTPITGDTTTGLVFSGWRVTWAGIPSINMGGGTQDCGTTSDGTCVTPGTSPVDIGGTYNNGTGIATFTWDGTYGNAYTLSYRATVPQADPSGFGGVPYGLELRGVVNEAVSAVPIPAAVWLFGSGLLGLVGVARRKKKA